MSSTKPDFPSPVTINGRLYFDGHKIENYKRQLLGLPELPRDPSDKIEMRPAKDVCAEFGFGRRTLGRRVEGKKNMEAA